MSVLRADGAELRPLLKSAAARVQGTSLLLVALFCLAGCDDGASPGPGDTFDPFPELPTPEDVTIPNPDSVTPTDVDVRDIGDIEEDGDPIEEVSDEPDVPEDPEVEVSDPVIPPDTDVEPDVDTDTAPDEVTPDTTPDAPDTDVEQGEPNACGGLGSLRFLGDRRQPGETCGPCGAGVLVCEGPGGLRCAGEGTYNACGGCGPLQGMPSDACGPCGDGVYVCDTGGVRCEGARRENLCGGCAVLAPRPGGECVLDPVMDGRWSCVDEDEIVCAPPGEANVCGGVETLLWDGEPGFPGSACESTCGEGVLVCDGLEGLRCAGAEEPNACGGCGPLPGVPGDACGACDGVWTCDGEEVACAGGSANACGGCQDLGSAPGSSCGGNNQRFACSGRNSVTCRLPSSSVNACGGTVPLPGRPGDACGACDEGRWVCDGYDGLRCEGDAGEEAYNACGGCETLPDMVGSACGVCASGTVVCDGYNAIRCDDDEGEAAHNVCGGCVELPEAGEACGLCTTTLCDDTELRCQLDRQPFCAGTATCSMLRCDDQYRLCIEAEEEADARCDDCIAGWVEDDDGACVEAQCEEEAGCEAPEPEAWSTCEYASECALEGVRERTVYFGVCEGSLCREPRVEIETEACHRETDLETCDAGLCQDGVCEGPPPEPIDVEASDDDPEQVVLRWEVQEGAWVTGIEVRANAGTPIPLEADVRMWMDLDAEPGGITPCAVTATAGTRPDGVLLECIGGSAEPGMPRLWEVRLVNPAGMSPWSESVVGQRSIGALEVRWERRRSDAPYGWDAIDVVPEDERFLDISAEPGVSYRYRAVLSATGAADVTTGDVAGARKAAPASAPGGLSATTSRQDGIRLTWQAVPEATGYEVRVGEYGDWVDVGTALSWDDPNAPLGTFELCEPAATDQTIFGRVELQCPGASVGPSETVTYAVRARNDAGAGPAGTATGARAAPTLRYRWERQIIGQPAFSTLVAQQDSHTFEDTSLGPGVRANYRASVLLQPVPGAQVRPVVVGGPRVIPEIVTEPARDVSATSIQWRLSFEVAPGTFPGDLGFCVRQGALSCEPVADQDCPAGATRAGATQEAGSVAYNNQTGLSPFQTWSMCPFIAGPDGQYRRGEVLVVETPGILLGGPCANSTACESGSCHSSGVCAPQGFQPIRSTGGTIGSASSYIFRYPNEPQRFAAFTWHWFMQTTEATREEWQALMGVDPSLMTGCGANCPVDNITWWDALAFANARSEAEDLPPCYVLSGCSGTPGDGLSCSGVTVTGEGSSVYRCKGYRLPTEGEWEVAYRAGSDRPIYDAFLTEPDCNVDPELSVRGRTCANSEVSWEGCFSFNLPDLSGSQCSGPAAVQSYEAGGFGLYDMAGNVMEWVWDGYADQPGGGTDFVGETTLSSRVVRGGSWRQTNRDARAATRDGLPPSTRRNDLGVRLARTTERQMN